MGTRLSIIILAIIFLSSCNSDDAKKTEPKEKKNNTVATLFKPNEPIVIDRELKYVEVDDKYSNTGKSGYVDELKLLKVNGTPHEIGLLLENNQLDMFVLEITPRNIIHEVKFYFPTSDTKFTLKSINNYSGNTATLFNSGKAFGDKIETKPGRGDVNRIMFTPNIFVQANENNNFDEFYMMLVTDKYEQEFKFTPKVAKSFYDVWKQFEK